jgi:hypothetical protein
MISTELQISIAIMIPIKNRSGKNADRFSCSNRIPVFPVKPTRDLLLKTGSRPAAGATLEKALKYPE